MTLAVVGLVGLVAAKLTGNYVVNSLVAQRDDRQAANNAWNILTDLMRGSFRLMIVVGILFLVAAWLAGPGRRALTARGWIAPAFRNRAWAYVALAIVGLFLLLNAQVIDFTRVLFVLLIVALGGDLDRDHTEADAARVPGRRRSDSRLRRARADVRLVGREAERARRAECGCASRADRRRSSPRRFGRPAHEWRADRRGVRRGQGQGPRGGVGKAGRPRRAPNSAAWTATSQRRSSPPSSGWPCSSECASRSGMPSIATRAGWPSGIRQSPHVGARRSASSSASSSRSSRSSAPGASCPHFPRPQQVASAFLASSAVLAVIAGLALTTPLGNLGSGVLLAFTQPVRLGDRITVERPHGHRRRDLAELHGARDRRGATHLRPEHDDGLDDPRQPLGRRSAAARHGRRARPARHLARRGPAHHDGGGVDGPAGRRASRSTCRSAR